MKQLNRRSQQFGIFNPQSTIPIDPISQNIETNNIIGNSHSQAYDQATGLGAINRGPVDPIGTFSKGMMMKSPLKELSSEALVEPFPQNE